MDETEQTQHSLISEIDESTDDLVEIPGPQIIHPVLVEPPPLSHIQSSVEHGEMEDGDRSSGSVKSEEELTKNPITPHMLAKNYILIYLLYSIFQSFLVNGSGKFQTTDFA